MSSGPPAIHEIMEARKTISGRIHRTPVFTSSGINRVIGAELFFKCENLQKTGSFKIRGASNAVFSHGKVPGFATHSSGNHAAALTLAASWRGASAHIVMPESSPGFKKKAVRGYGAEIYFCHPTLRAREEKLKEVVNRTGAVFIHPYDDPLVIAGQGTAALEFLEDVEGIDSIIVPVGGGGLLSGTALTVKAMNPHIQVIAAEPAGADDAFRSFNSGDLIPSENPDTIADGLLTSLSELTFGIIREKVSDIVTVSEDSIKAGMRMIWERMKLVVEPSAAVPLGALIEKRDSIPGKRIGVILSGGNVDLEHLPF
ncbi:MAG: pyridoxal-phosphate dependent enzyme [Candidatus Latescibacteria bacterium]|nr:pyridoxal-phosphate dependent enzyme [bacterium]MBD3423716.1 pyridoxal-phosphate dependent enzyme [Candidatus Latescibacterota bacterium]